MKDQLRMLIIEHSLNVTEKGHSELKGFTCGLAVDGATLISLHVYAFIIIYKDDLRLAGFKQVEQQTGAELAKAISDVVQKCEKHGISISGIVNDNTAALKAATTNTDTSKFITLKAMVGEEVLGCACAAHTSQLAVKDLINGVHFLEDFLQTVIGIISFISSKSDDFQNSTLLK